MKDAARGRGHAMKRLVALVTALSLTGCYFHAVEKPQTTSWVERGETRRTDGDEIALALTSTPREIHVQASVRYTCSVEQVEVTRTTYGEEVELSGLGDDWGDGGGGPNGDGVGLLVFVVAITVVFSAIALLTLIPAAIDAAYERDPTESRRDLGGEPVPCNTPAPDLEVELQLASGTRVTVETDAHGEARFRVPPTEVDGRIVARAKSATPVAGTFFRSRRSCTSTREQMFAEPATDAAQRIAILSSLPACGTLGDDEAQVEEAWAALRAAGIAAWEGDCAAALREADRLRRVAPTMVARLDGEVAFAACD